MDKLPSKPKKPKGLTREELITLDKDELVEKVIQLTAHNVQLKNILSKTLSEKADTENNTKKKPSKSFDFSKSHTRRVLLRLTYLGWRYHGLAVQEHTTLTVEHQLFLALTKACLIESRETAQYHRCGRTDKGVSAFGQVISITLRSKFPSHEQRLPSSITNEMPYCKILNRLLPPDIRAVAWMDVPEDTPEYSARFDCKKRTYKYYFPRSSLDIKSMMAACQQLIGSHDFRHLCKMDVGNGVVEFRREIFGAKIVPVDGNDLDQPTSMFYLQLEANAFLWHQIRCIMGLLLLVGQGQEEPGVIRELLDVEKNPRKPQYNMALDVPLNLFHCSYDLEETGQWYYDKEELKSVIIHFQNEWTVHNVKTTMISDCLKQLEEVYKNLQKETQVTQSKESERNVINAHTNCLLEGVKPKVYKPLLKRETCSSLEERIEYYRKRRKVETKDMES